MTHIRIHDDRAVTTDEEFGAFSRRIFECRDCRVANAQFATLCGGMQRPPEIVHGPSADRVLATIRRRLALWWPELVV